MFSNIPHVTRYGLPHFPPFHQHSYRNPAVVYHSFSSPFSITSRTTYLRFHISYQSFPVNPSPFSYRPIPHHSDCPVHQTAAKTNIGAKAIINPETARLIGRIANANERLETLMEHLENSLNQFEEFPDLKSSLQQLIKEAAHLRKQQPTQNLNVPNEGSLIAYETAITSLNKELLEKLTVLQKQAKELTNQPKLPLEPCLAPVQVIASPVQKTEEAIIIENFALAANYVDSAYQTFQNAFNELKQKNSSFEQYTNVFTVREKFWEMHLKKAFETDLFEELNKETKRQEKLDFFLVVLLEDQVNQAKNFNVKMQSQLEIVLSLNDHETFVAKMTKACNEAHLSIPSVSEFDETKTHLMNVLFAAEKHDNEPFLTTLKECEAEFLKEGYTSIASHYTQTIREFQDIANNFLKAENIETYTTQWNALLKEFDPQHQFLLKLKEAQQALNEHSKKLTSWINDKKIEETASTFQMIEERSRFIDQRHLLTQSSEVNAYIKKIYEWIKFSESFMK